jgi:hypothetical protein
LAESEIIIIIFIQPSTPVIALASASSKFQTPVVYVNKQQNESWKVPQNKTKQKESWKVTPGSSQGVKYVNRKNN